MGIRGSVGSIRECVVETETLGGVSGGLIFYVEEVGGRSEERWISCLKECNSQLKPASNFGPWMCMHATTDARTKCCRNASLELSPLYYTRHLRVACC